ncbi:uncharacterized protein LOC141714462 [Apium graveolens]|uniref:uncharacterized protein LOC141714462 n=1 Tax=Apium graveolens TaxID=4045 RepID=UPI003D79E454
MLNVAYGNVGPNADAKKFLRLVEEGRQPLYPELLKEVVPEIRLPKSFNSAKTIIKDLGLKYVKIHACPSDCMLYWGDNEKEVKCRNCGVSRWKAVAQGSKNNKIAAKVMRYFQLKPRLQRMFLCKDFSKLMSWHAVDRKKDGKLWHPADGEAWKTMDAIYPHYSSDNWNVRLGVASDGFNPYRKMSSTHNIWPIVIVNYNLPPCRYTLIAELKDLWNVGVETDDALTDHNFMLHASVLWTISDFPGYAILSGWSTKGKLVCPTCNYETSSKYLKSSKKVCYMNHQKFIDPNHKWRSDKRRLNGDVETRETPTMLSGREIEVLLDGYVNTFKKGSKRKYLSQIAVKNIKACGCNTFNQTWNFLRDICAKVIEVGDLKRLQQEIVEILCQLEMIFSDPFIDIMVHLPSKPEGSITERYLEDECLTFCSRFLYDGHNISSNQFEIAGAETEGKHHELLANNENSKRYKRERIHADEICDWFKDEVGKKVEVFREVASLAKALTTSVASLKDQNPIVGDVGYYISVEEIFEVDYWGAFNVVLFRCIWYQYDKDSFGYIRVNFNRVCQKYDSFVMSTQVQQVFYIQDPVEKNCYYPIKRISPEFSEIGVGNTIEDDMNGKMTDLRYTIHLHHTGDFKRTKYTGGSHVTYDTDADKFSYFVLIDWVKEDLKYDEIGGVYVKKGMEVAGH